MKGLSGPFTFTSSKAKVNVSKCNHGLQTNSEERISSLKNDDYDS